MWQAIIEHSLLSLPNLIAKFVEFRSSENLMGNETIQSFVAEESV